MDSRTIDDITRKLKMFGGETQLTDNDKDIICKALENLKKQDQPSFTTYELVDKDVCTVMYLNIADLYPKEFVMRQIDQCIRDDVDSNVIKGRLTENCGAIEIFPEHVILPHIE